MITFLLTQVTTLLVSILILVFWFPLKSQISILSFMWHPFVLALWFSLQGEQQQCSKWRSVWTKTLWRYGISCVMEGELSSSIGPTHLELMSWCIDSHFWNEKNWELLQLMTEDCLHIAWGTTSSTCESAGQWKCYWALLQVYPFTLCVCLSVCLSFSHRKMWSPLHSSMSKVGFRNGIPGNGSFNLQLHLES